MELFGEMLNFVVLKFKHGQNTKCPYNLNQILFSFIWFAACHNMLKVDPGATTLVENHWLIAKIQTMNKIIHLKQPKKRSLHEFHLKPTRHQWCPRPQDNNHPFIKR